MAGIHGASLFGMLLLGAGLAAADEGEKIKTISKAGEAVEVKDHIVKGKYTVFEFYADW